MTSRLMGRTLGIAGPAFLILACGIAHGQNVSGSIDEQWRSYGHDPGGMRFSPLRQIDRTN
ncbi:MAG TPA: hypothetical protein VMG63_26485, partial [Terriglobia bacterium]|nr:hypothetical protein [Terriglobia bacterium]